MATLIWIHLLWMLVIAATEPDNLTPCRPDQFYDVEDRECLPCSLCLVTQIMSYPCNLFGDTQCVEFDHIRELLQTYDWSLEARNVAKLNRSTDHQVKELQDTPTDSGSFQWSKIDVVIIPVASFIIVLLIITVVVLWRLFYERKKLNLENGEVDGTIVDSHCMYQGRGLYYPHIERQLQHNNALRHFWSHIIGRARPGNEYVHESVLKKSFDQDSIQTQNPPGSQADQSRHPEVELLLATANNNNNGSVVHVV